MQPLLFGVSSFLISITTSITLFEIRRNHIEMINKLNKISYSIQEIKHKK